MASVSNAVDNVNVLDCFHQSALRHFERAHMIARDLDISQNNQVCPVAEHSAHDRNERCRQWVLHESGQCPNEVASWDGSVNLDSHVGGGRLDSCSAYAGLLDSCRSGPHGIVQIKTVPILESWTSSRSPTMFHVQAFAKPELLINSSDAHGAHGQEAPHLSSSPNTRLEI